MKEFGSDNIIGSCRPVQTELQIKEEMWRHRDGNSGTLLAVLEAGERFYSYR